MEETYELKYSKKDWELVDDGDNFIIKAKNPANLRVVRRYQRVLDTTADKLKPVKFTLWPKRERRRIAPQWFYDPWWHSTWWNDDDY